MTRPLAFSTIAHTSGLAARISLQHALQEPPRVVERAVRLPGDEARHFRIGGVSEDVRLICRSEFAQDEPLRLQRREIAGDPDGRRGGLHGQHLYPATVSRASRAPSTRFCSLAKAMSQVRVRSPQSGFTQMRSGAPRMPTACRIFS